MIRINKFTGFILLAAGLSLTSCDKDDTTTTDNFDTAGTYNQNDQMARPAINTVFVNASRKTNSIPPHHQ